MDSLTRIEDRFRHAVESRQYGDADQLALQYGEAARQAVDLLPSGDPGRAQIARRVLDTFEWARLLLLIGRAFTARELRRIPFLNSYLPVVRRLGIRLDA